MSEISPDDMEFEEFTQDELDSLNTFHDQATKILNSKLVKSGLLECHYHGSVKDDGTIIETVKCPGEEEAAFVLMALRTFLQMNNKTKIFIKHILSILKTKSANDKTKAFFESMETNYGSSMEDTDTTVIKNGKQFTGMELFNFMNYADKFHTDGDKKNFINSLGLTENAKNAIYYQELIKVCNWVVLINRVIEAVILKKN